LLTQDLAAFCEGEGHELAEALEVGHGNSIICACEGNCRKRETVE
jgi:hypothetical protein